MVVSRIKYRVTHVNGQRSEVKRSEVKVLALGRRRRDLPEHRRHLELPAVYALPRAVSYRSASSNTIQTHLIHQINHTRHRHTTQTHQTTRHHKNNPIKPAASEAPTNHTSWYVHLTHHQTTTPILTPLPSPSASSPPAPTTPPPLPSAPPPPPACTTPSATT